MSAPRRYRLALLAFPRAARERHATDLLGVLSAADAERGSASWREAAHLLRAGAGLRMDRALVLLTPPRLLQLASAMSLIAAFAPGAAWARRTPPGYGFAVFAGPTPGLRWALLAAAAFAIATTFSRRDHWLLVATTSGAASALLALGLSVGVPRPRGPGFLGVALEHALLLGAASAGALWLVSLGLSRLSAPLRLRVAAAGVILACAAAVAMTVRASPPQGLGPLAVRSLGPAGLLAAATGLLAAITLLAGHHWPGRAQHPGAHRAPDVT